MANRTISDLPVTTVVAAADIIHCRQSTTDKSVSQAKIAEYAQTLSDYAPTVVSVTGTTHTVSTTIRKQLIICTITANCTFTFPGSFGNAKEIIVRNESGSVANVLGLPNSEVLYPGSEITFVWNGTAWIKRTFSTNLLTGTAAPTITPSFIGQTFVDGTNDNIYIATGTGATTDWTGLLPTKQNIIEIAADYVIADTILSGTKFLVSPNSSTQKGIITITLPTMADNIGKWYDIEFKTGQGLILIDGEGGEYLNFKGTRILTALIYSAGMGYRVNNNGTDWTMKGTNIMRVGWHGRSDWTTVHIGNGVLYDNGSGTSTKSTDWTGMVITEATSGFTAVVVEDTGGVGTTGTLYYFELSSSFTFFTNNRILTASNGETIDINEVSGSSKNQDRDFYHSFGIDKNRIGSSIFWYNTATYTGAYELIPSSEQTASALPVGTQITQIDVNSIKLQTATNGAIEWINDAGNMGTLSSDDVFLDLILDFSC